MSLPAPSEAPDGGWGWMIVLASFIQSALFFGVIRSFGVFFVEFMAYFEESASRTSWISAVTMAVSMFTCPLASALGTQFGERPVAVVGGLLSGIGLLLASFATSLVQLYFFIGLFTGLGGTFVFSSTISLLGQYFSRRRGLANSLAFSGPAVSSLVFPALFQFLVDSYGWRGALLVVAGMVFNMVISAALLRPLPLAQKETLESKERDNPCSRLAFLFQIPLFHHRAFMIFCVADMIIICGYFIPFIYLVPHARVIGFDEYQAALLISVVSIADLGGRIIAGWLADCSSLRFVHSLALWTFLTGVSLFLIPLGCSYGVLVLLSISYGFLASAIIPLKISSMMELVSTEQIMGAIGLLSLLESPGALAGPPLAGWIRDVTGTYDASFLVAGSIVLAGSLTLLLLPDFFSCHPCASLRLPEQRTRENSQDAPRPDVLCPA